MVCHRWTLALILFTVPLLVSVISAFRVRLPGASHEVKSDLRRHICEDCDVSDINLDPVTPSSKTSAKRFDDIKKILKEKRHLIEEKLSKPSLKNIGDSQEDSDDDDDDSVLEKLKIESAKVKTDAVIKAKSKKPSLVLDFNDDDDDDSDIDDDDEYDEIKEKPHQKDADFKKKIDETVIDDAKKVLPKSKVPIEKSDEADIDKIPLKELKHKIIPSKDILKESLKTKEKSTKPVKPKDDDRDDGIEQPKKISRGSEKVQIKTEDKKEISVKETSIPKPKVDKVVVEEHIIDKVKSNKIDSKTIKDPVKVTEGVGIKIKSVEKAAKIIASKEKPHSIPKVEELKTTKESEDEKESEDKNALKEVRVQHSSDALHRRNLLQSEFEDFYAFFPTFAPNFSRIHNPECRRHGQILLRQLRGSKLWALNMLDATAKIPSGLLQGNGIQLGDFDQCLGIRARVQLDTGSVVKVQGKYCLAMVDVKAEQTDLEMPVHLAQARNLFKSRIDDPGHFVPRFSTLSWGVCVPSPCGPEDVAVVLRDAIKHYQYKTGISFRVKVDETDCHIRRTNWWKDWIDIPTALTISLYAIIIILVFLATLQDFLNKSSTENDSTEEDDKGDSEEKEKRTNESADGFLSSFSLYNTLGKLVGPANEDEIACIHGVRAVATMALLVAHKFLPVALTPYTNRVRISEIVSSPLLSWSRAGWMFTDCFLLLSGTLSAYRKSSNDTMASKLLSRYLRLTPALLAVVFFYAYVWDNISSGPMWGTLVTKNAELCQEGWWANLLYIQNYYDFEEMCAPQTHHMALDFQLTVIGGIIVWAIQSEVPFAATIMPLLHLASAYSRYTTFRDHRLTVLAYQGVSVSQLYRTGRLSYTSIFHRCTPYLIGISLGLALRNPSTLSKILNILGWFICGTLLGLVLWAGADSGYLDYRYDVTFSALYATLAPIATALVFAWLIYAVHNGQSAILTRLLSSRPLLFISRISYAMYLIQFIVYLTNTATIRTPKEFSLLSLIDFQEIATILFSSVLLTITLVIPLQSLPKISISSKTEEDAVSEDSKNESNKALNEEKGDKDEQVKEAAQTRRSFLAHREVLEEIPEADVEYEIQRDSNEGLEEILEEEDGDEEDRLDDEDLEVIEEEQGEEEQGEDEPDEDFWAERREYLSRRSFSDNNDDQDRDEWEWTANGNETGSQNYRDSR